MEAPTKHEIYLALDRIDPEFGVGKNSQWPGMSYEQGVQDVLMWVLGHSGEDPTEEMDQSWDEYTK